MGNEIFYKDYKGGITFQNTNDVSWIKEAVEAIKHLTLFSITKVRSYLSKTIDRRMDTITAIHTHYVKTGRLDIDSITKDRSGGAN